MSLAGEFYIDTKQHSNLIILKISGRCHCSIEIIIDEELKKIQNKSPEIVGINLLDADSFCSCVVGRIAWFSYKASLTERTVVFFNLSEKLRESLEKKFSLLTILKDEDEFYKKYLNTGRCRLT